MIKATSNNNDIAPLKQQISNLQQRITDLTRQRDSVKLQLENSNTKVKALEMQIEECKIAMSTKDQVTFWKKYVKNDTIF